MTTEVNGRMQQTASGLGDRRRGGLGRGLAALIPSGGREEAPAALPLDRIDRNPYQPRREIDEQELERLAASIREHGVLQPIVVARYGARYRLIAGERRLRAAELAGLERIPAVVRDADEVAQLELALVENLQRADLNPLEEARAFRQLVDDFGWTHEQVAVRMGRSRSSVANTVRLLDVSPRTQAALAALEISEGHARAIAGLATHEAQDRLLALVLARRLSVRQTEEAARRAKEEEPKRASRTRAGDPELERLESELRTSLGTKVSVFSTQKGRGRIVIEYYDSDDLGRLADLLTATRA